MFIAPGLKKNAQFSDQKFQTIVTIFLLKVLVHMSMATTRTIKGL